MHFHITLRELPDIIQPYDVIVTDPIGQLIENVSAGTAATESSECYSYRENG